MGEGDSRRRDTRSDRDVSRLSSSESVTKTRRTASVDREVVGPAAAGDRPGSGKDGPDVPDAAAHLQQYGKERRRPTEVFRLKPRHAIILVAFSFFVVTSIAGVYSFYVSKRLWELQLRIVTMESDLKDLRSRYDIGAEVRNRRLDILEGAVFGVVIPKATRATAGEAWQRNREDELRVRIKALEEWRLSKEKEDRQ